jgi:hypothetical protein
MCRQELEGVVIKMVEKSFMVRQISVFLDNRPGSLAEIARHLANRDINLHALSLAETRDFEAARLIAADPDACGKALNEAQYHFIETDVLAVKVADKPDGMADVLEIIAQEHLNVEYMYAMVEKKEGFAVIILRVDDPLKACMVLHAKGVKLLAEEDIASL